MFTKSFDRNSQPNTTQTHNYRAVFAKGFLLACLVLLVNSVATRAAYTVSNTAELITAIEKANAATGISLIYMKPGTYTPLTAYKNTDNAFPKITASISIVGLFNGAVIARPGTAPPFRFFEVGPTGQLWIDRLTLTLGQGNGVGGAILNYGSLTVLTSYFIRNLAVNPTGPSAGGAIYNQFGKVVIRNSSFFVNRAALGGGIASDGSLATLPAPNQIAQVTIETSALVENAAQDKGFGALGGGLFIRGANEINIHDTTISGNSSPTYGGGLVFQFVPKINHVSLRNLTVVDNQATLEGGGIYYDSGSLPYYAMTYVEIQNSIVTNNGPAAPNRDFAGNGVIKSLGHNIYGTFSNYFSGYTDFYAPFLANLTYHDDKKPGDQYWWPEIGCLALNNGDPANAGTSDQLSVVRGSVNDIGAIERP